MAIQTDPLPIFRSRHLMIAMCLIVTILSSASASPNTLTVQGGRPVDKAIQELEKRYGWQITYEDPPYIHYSDITDVSDNDWPGVPVQSPSQLQLARESGAHHRTLVPKGASLTFTLPSAGAGLLHVVPRKARGLSGNLELVKPVLDTLITIEPRARTSYELLEEVLKKISVATNANVVIGVGSENMLDNTKTSIGGSGKTARSILEQWILEDGSSLSWRLFYGPSMKWYVLNVSQVSAVKKQ